MSAWPATFGAELVIGGRSYVDHPALAHIGPVALVTPSIDGPIQRPSWALVTAPLVLSVDPGPVEANEGWFVFAHRLDAPRARRVFVDGGDVTRIDAGEGTWSIVDATRPIEPFRRWRRHRRAMEAAA